MWLDRAATAAKAARLIEEAADNGAQVFGFSEGFVPGFPEPQILYCDADMEKVIEGKLSHDLTGHYNRFVVFTLQMRPSPSAALDTSGSMETGLARIEPAPETSPRG